MSKVKFLVAVMLSVLVAACSEEENLSQAGKTGFYVSLTEDVKVDSRSTPEKIGKPLASQFNLKITNQATGNTVHDALFKGKEGETEFIPAAAGTYKIEATYGDNPVLALDDPYYKGMAEDVVLEDGEQETVKIECEVANALASVKFSDEGAFKFADQFEEGYGVEVLVLDKTTTLDGKQSAYYRAGSTPTFIFKGTTKNGGEEVSFTLSDDKFAEAATFAAKAHCVITLKIAAVEPGVRVEISKVEVDSVTVSETIPMEWLPKPKVTAEGFTNNTLAMYETETPTAKFNFNLSSALQDMKFKFNFQDEQFATLDKEKTYLLSVPEEKAAIEEALGITLPNVGDKPESIDLSKLLAKLQTNAGVTTTNTIEIDAKANNRWSSEVKEGEEAPNLKYTLTCNKPVFHVDAYPGNIWTKEFTMNALREEQVESGDFAKISGNIKYQYSMNQEQWSDLGSDLRQANLTAGTTYYIRGLYRGEVPGEVAEVKTYEAINIPNSTLDEGYDTTYPKSNNPLYIFKGGWIDTRNELTCHSNGANTFYVSKSSTLPVNDNESTVAHMMVIGWGAGNSCAFGFKTGSVINNISSGLVCVGDYDVNSDVINPKEAYIRPSSLTFTYKASPYNGDEYLIEATLLNITDGIETIIGEGKLQSGASVNSYTTQSLDITYDESVKELPISHVKVLFKAGTKENRDHLEDKFRDASFPYSSAYLIGSQFWLDSFQFNYDK